ncbi:DUF1194 domain-containing protein [Halotia branconii]|uniref:DUF1194 domain-containing protein n=1 Tax=Halotia branconii CENA392 TaxID=1539056 RepID=A0AAJ6NY60_9CYAN|nr:DUF1194 domain-containing protein [Halotia branconii]WGV28909.1 DUF1194 domain-containing protein [Halotia branconii CENA392]
MDSVASLQSFSDAINATTRPFSGSTAPGSAINFATPRFFDNDFDGTRLVMDVSGDGVQNVGANTAAARDNALASGINAINGLVIGGGTGLFNFYDNNVKGGTDAFVLSANSFEDFANTVEQKIRIEVSNPPEVPQGVPEPTPLIGLLGLGVFGVTTKLKQSQKQSVKC